MNPCYHKDYMRLECLKLAHRFDHEACRVIERARAYETYVSEETLPPIIEAQEALPTGIEPYVVPDEVQELFAEPEPLKKEEAEIKPAGKPPRPSRKLYPS